MRRVFNLPHLKEVRRQLRHDRSPAEHILWRYLKGRQLLGLKFRRQHSIGRYIVDFYCPSRRLVVEVDGDGRFDEAGIYHDKNRDRFFQTLGIRTFRVRNDEVIHDPFSVIERLKEFLTTP